MSRNGSLGISQKKSCNVKEQKVEEIDPDLASKNPSYERDALSLRTIGSSLQLHMRLHRMFVLSGVLFGGRGGGYAGD